MKLTLKFAFAFLLGLIAVLTVYAYTVFARETELFQSDMMRDNRLIGQVVAMSAQQVWQASGVETAKELIAQADQGDSHVRLRWIWLDAAPNTPDASHVPAADLGALRNGQPTGFFERFRGKVGYLYIYFPVAREGDRIGALEVAEDLEDQRTYTRATLVRTGTTTAVIAAVSGVLALVLGTWFVGRPIERFARTMQRVASGDLSDRVDVRQHDELGLLARELNIMCDRLAEANLRVAAETTARIRALEQLRHADRLRTVGQLTSGIAHELGTPLNVVSGRAKMIAAGEVADTEAADCARIIVEQSARMTAIIRQLLEFARPRRPQRARVDIVQVIQRTLTLLISSAEKRGVKLNLADGAGSATAEVDADQFQQVLSNLVLNAIQAMPSGGPVTIGVRRERVRPPADHGGPEGEYVCVYVRDQGVGIAAENLARIFEPFFTTKDIGQGTGLGLSVSLGIVRENGGWIAVESQLGQGACFNVYLPPG